MGQRYIGLHVSLSLCTLRLMRNANLAQVM